MILAVAAFSAMLLAPPQAGATAPADADELVRLVDSTRPPLPILPVAVPQVTGESDVAELVTSSTRPVLFQVSHATGPDADPAQTRFFQLLSIEYALEIDFRKVAAGSPAGLRLFPQVTRPVYILCGASAQQQSHKCFFLNEAGMPQGRLVDGPTLEGFIFERLGITPRLLTTFALTPGNYKQLVFDYRPAGRHPVPTARWIGVLFFPGGKDVPGAVDSLRQLVALERFFYNGRLRIAECDLSASGAVYEALIPGAAAIPNRPELWLIDPVTHRARAYPGNGKSSSLIGLTHSDFQGWLARNGISSTPHAAIDTGRAWATLAELEGQSK